MDVKNFLFVSLDNLSADVAWCLKKEGHNVKYYVQEKEDLDVGDGFVEKINDWEKEIDWADVLIFDDVLGHGKIADELRKKGKKVIGGTEYTDRLEDDRSFGQEELIKHGIEILPYKNFTSFDEAIEFIKNNPSSYVIKPTGLTPPTTKGILFIGEQPDGADVIHVLQDYKEAWSDILPEFQLQKKTEGIEIAVGAFFNGNEFIYPININFEHKKLFPGDIGPSTGEMGTAMFWSKPNKIFNKTLKKFENKLRQEKFVGYIDLNCIVDESGIYPLEFTSRFGYPTIFIQMEGINNPIGKFFFDLASGVKTKLNTKPGFQIGVRLLVPPFPFNDDETFKVKSKGSVIYFLDPKKDKKGIHIEDVKLIKNKWIVTGSSGVVMTVCGTGANMKKAQEEAYSRIKNINIPLMFYRKDIGERWFSEGDLLHTWGYLDDE